MGTVPLAALDPSVAIALAVGAAGVVVLVVILMSLKRKRSPAPPPEVKPAPVQAADEPVAAAQPQEVPAGPRRAVSFPTSDSDTNRASEQTLKRMTVEDIESASSVEKPPRASEIPENPILPDGPCKVRCLDCDKKMKADGAKFMRQRRCPNCKAAPFRYVTAV